MLHVKANLFRQFPVQECEYLRGQFHYRGFETFERQILNSLHADETAAHHYGPSRFFLLEVVEDTVCVFKGFEGVDEGKIHAGQRR